MYEIGHISNISTHQIIVSDSHRSSRTRMLLHSSEQSKILREPGIFILHSVIVLDLTRTVVRSLIIEYITILFPFCYNSITDLNTNNL